MTIERGDGGAMARDSETAGPEVTDVTALTLEKPDIGSAYERLLEFARQRCGRVAERAAALETKRMEAHVLREREALTGEEYALRAIWREEFGGEVFEAWFDQVRWERISDGIVILSVPKAFVKTWILHRYGAAVRDACMDIVPEAKGFELVVREAESGKMSNKEENNSDAINKTTQNTNDDAFEIFGAIKWYDKRKGLGVIVPDNGSEDIFLTRQCLGASQIKRVYAGARIKAIARRVSDYLQAICVLSVDFTAADLPKDLPVRVKSRRIAPESKFVLSTCKWYDSTRGIGVLTLDDGGREVFVSFETMRRFGIGELARGEKIQVRWGTGPKGFTAVALRPYEEEAAVEEDDPDPDPDAEPRPVDGEYASLVLRPKRPLLQDLAGMPEAREWGLSLAADLASYARKEIRWSDVDPGALIFGAPGTGKTTFAKALAATCGVALVATSYTQWQQAGTGHLGNVLRAMEDDFAAARKHAPSILFIDELDTVPTRHQTRHNDEWWISIVNALLEKLDGLVGRTGVIVLGACNDASGIDPALLRAGRLDRRIAIPPPNITALEQIIAFQLGKDAKEVGDLKALAVLCAGMTGADVVQLIRDGRRIARRRRAALSLDDLCQALQQGADALCDDVLRRIATHEAGHAVAAICRGAAKDVSVTVLARGRIGGRTICEENAVLAPTRQALGDQLVGLLAGRAAEEVVLGSVSAGAGGSHDSDLGRATRLALDMVGKLGLGESGSLTWHGPGVADQSLLLDRTISDEVASILNASYASALSLITEKRGAVTAVAEALMQRRALVHDELRELIDGRG